MTIAGLMMYCFKHNYGCLIQGYIVPKNINKSCCGNEKKCEWEDIGVFKHANNLNEFHGPNEEWYRIWIDSKLNKNMYDSHMNLMNVITL